MEEIIQRTDPHSEPTGMEIRTTTRVQNSISSHFLVIILKDNFFSVEDRRAASGANLGLISAGWSINTPLWTRFKKSGNYPMDRP